MCTHFSCELVNVANWGFFWRNICLKTALAEFIWQISSLPRDSQCPLNLTVHQNSKDNRDKPIFPDQFCEVVFLDQYSKSTGGARLFWKVERLPLLEMLHQQVLEGAAEDQGSTRFMDLWICGFVTWCHQCRRTIFDFNKLVSFHVALTAGLSREEGLFCRSR